MKHRVLVVDDDPLYREILKNWLESEGHEAILAETLEEGFIGLAMSPLPDVVLLDIHIGSRNGLVLVHWARKQKHLAHMPIAVITDLASFKELKIIGEAGCDTCFNKPVDFNSLRKYFADLGVYSAS